jgi:isoamylase
MLKFEEGESSPLGAVWDGRGVNFALYSANATSVDLCLFDSTGRRQIERAPLPCRTDLVWHGYVRGLRPGQLYGYRAHGPYEPERGHRFNPHKLLIDPYARELFGRIRWNDALFGYRLGAQRTDLAMDRRDSAPMVPKCVVEGPGYQWGDDRRPQRPWPDSFIYEAHVKGLTKLHPGIPADMRGTFSALGHPATIDHLLKLGVTAIELMPVQAFADDRILVEKNLHNYWGYATLAFFAPEPRFLGEDGIFGFKSAIRSLHDAGIEVILDVVYNHTVEGNQLGPTLSFRGIDNASYYKLASENPRFNWDSTGTGNTLDLDNPFVMRLALDSLRHWATAYRIDGFRFDLAPSLARTPYDFNRRAAFLGAVGQDPILSRLKLIAEPWDLGQDGYQVGGFPVGWSEWNDRFRDSVRTFWRGDAGVLPRLAQAITGSREIFQRSGRQPWASVQFVCSHDGFTLHDLVSYEHRRNAANGEDNRDGQQDNLSWNCGVEGDTDDPAILALRARQKRNLLATLLLSIGAPMLLMGDELSRTQQGNNNPYCQDNEVSWLDWERGRVADPMLQTFVQTLVAIRRGFTAFRRRAFLAGAVLPDTKLKDVYWLASEGREMTTQDWGDAERKALGAQVGNDADETQRLLMLLNAGDQDVSFRLPADFPGGRWIHAFDTSLPDGLVRRPAFAWRAGEGFKLAARSLSLFQNAPLLGRDS